MSSKTRRRGKPLPKGPSDLNVAIAEGHVHVEQALKLGDGAVHPGAMPPEPPSFLHPTVTRPRLKLQAARYFLELLRQRIRNEAASIMHFDAAVSALRSATFVLQKEGSGKPGFDEWYQAQQDKMKADRILRLVVDLRNEAEKEGTRLQHYQASVQVRHHLNGEIRAQTVDPELRIAGHPECRPLDDLLHAIRVLDEVIEEAHSRGFVSTPNGEKEIRMEFLRQTPSGTWEHFDPGGPGPTVNS
jgi:hypothetical protein